MSLSKPRILVVDDDSVTLKLIQKTLEKHELCSASAFCSSSEEGLNRLIIEPYDILILDYAIDDMNGIEFLQEARKIQRIDASILMTDTKNPDVIVESMRNGMNDFLQKPIHLENLKLAINHVWHSVQMQWNIEENASKYENLINAIPDIVYKINTETEIVFINNAVRSLGYEPEELIGQKISTIIHREDVEAHTRKNVLRRFKNVITGGKNAPKLIDERRTGERMTKNLGIRLIPKPGSNIDIEMKDGSLFSFGEISATGLIEKSAQASNFDSNIYSVGIIRDITMHKDEKENLQLQKQNAVKANQAKSDFLANMSHEIRTPMNGILGAASLLIEEELGNQAKEYAEMILHSTKSLLTIINDILCLSKIESGKLDIESSYVNLRRLTKDVFDILKHTANKKDIEFELFHDASFHDHFYGDATRIRQILINLAGNAIKFTDAGHVHIKVSLALKHQDIYELCIDITDSGIGISESNLQKLFNRFSQANSTITREFGGTGLGLSISQKLAHLMGGEIIVKSKYGEGSTFSLTLPLKKSQKTEIKIEEKINNLKRNYHKHALIVEDNDINQKLAQKILTKLGITSECAGNGLEGINMASTKNYDLILMDLQMPLMDGVTAATQIKEGRGLNHATPIFALTANVTNEYKKACLKVGMNSFITKPIKREELISELDKFIG